MSRSDNNNSANRQNVDLLRKVAYNVLEPDVFDNLENYTLDEITDAIYDQYYGDKYPQVQKVDSEVDIDLAEDELLETTNLEAPSDIWVFGYGSLIWKVDFPYISRKAGFIKGYERKFYQNSIDHRGSPEKPGRVVTLIPSSDPDAKVWGIGYRISNKVKNSVVQNLDVREKNGYSRLPVLFYVYPQKGSENRPIEMTAYVATEKNSSYAGHINNIDTIADQVFTASGPSGSNREYVYKLANAMRLLFPGQQDSHLFELEEKVRTKEEEYMASVNEIKENIRQILERGVLGSTPVGDIRLDLKNLDPHA